MADGAVAEMDRFPGRKAFFESRREREFYRYYEPIRQLSENGPSFCDLHCADAVAAHRAISSPDRALTAFCQLGALRLKMRRAMLFFFDRNHAYVLAEATRSLSLQDDSNHDPEDQLWLGHTIIPRGFSVCEHTTDLPVNLGSNCFDESSTVAHIVNDLTGDIRFCDQPYVCGGPRARFYAGVPIVSNGINIGAYCVLDDKVRDGISEKDVTFLRDMSATIMLHLDMVRAKAEHQRATQMMNGLGEFMRGVSDLDDAQEWGRARQPSVTTSQTPPNNPAGQSSGKEYDASDTIPAPVSDQIDFQEKLLPASSTSGNSNGIEPPSLTSRDSQSTVESVANVESGKSRSTAEGLNERLMSAEVHHMFERAAPIARRAVQLDGVVFLDASIGAYAGLISSPEKDDSEGCSDSPMSSRDTSASDRDGTRLRPGNDEIEYQRPCVVLGSSHATWENNSSVGSTQSPAPFAAKLLRSFMRKYPTGKIWNFSEDGSTSDDDDRSSSPSEPFKRRPTSAGVKTNDADTMRRTLRRRRQHFEEHRALQRLFPGVRGLALTSMRNPSTGRWFAGCFMWTYSPTRILSSAGEGVYMAAFGDLIMQELSRMEARRAERAKSDFVSSISHELRSPLHGILGSVECLQEDDRLDDLCQGLVAKIDVCGRTLIDIIDHLLEFSEVSRHSSGPTNKVNQLLDPRRRKSATKVPTLGGIMSIDPDTPLDRITEETVETAVYSYVYSKDRQNVQERNVDVVLDIDHATLPNWNCKVPTGAWKRICINLVNNALKYTQQGCILVNLTAAPVSNRRRRVNCILSVKDTGCGMSKDFLENLLFRPFTQEDALVEGTGLGISLISKIVKNLGGRIDVQSERGVGTTFTVTVPMERSRVGREASINDASSPPQKTFANLSMGIFASTNPPGVVDSREDEAVRQALLLSSTEKSAAHLGLKTRFMDGFDSRGVDLCFITQKFLERLSLALEKGLSEHTMLPIDGVHKPLIVLCNDANSRRQMMASRSAQWLSPKVVYVVQPCGPQKLTEAVHACLHAEAEEAPRTERDLLGGQNYAPMDTPSRPNATRMISDLIPTIVAEADSTLPSTIQPMKTTLPLLPSSKPTPASGISLLLVDDNHINLQLLVTYAKKHNHAKMTATNGLEAVQSYIAATPTKPQFILMDINMPVLNGFEATRRIRQYEKQNNLVPATIIALTGLGSVEAKNEAYISGVDLFLTKPVRLKELTRILQAADAAGRSLSE